MAYDRYYTGGWQDGESGNTPITAAALNHIEDGLVAITESSTLTITRTANSYCDSESISSLSAVKKNGFLYLNGNLHLSANVPTNTDATEIARISGWSAYSPVNVTVAGQSGGGALGVSVNSVGILRIYNTSGSAAFGWHIFTLCVPAND